MSENAVPDVTQDGFSARVSHAGSTMALSLVGSADSFVVPALGATIGAVHLEAMRAAVTEVLVDLTALDFMNSSCLKTFISSLASSRELPAIGRYKLRMISDPKREWQRRSLAALVAFGGGVAEVEIRP